MLNYYLNVFLYQELLFSLPIYKLFFYTVNLNNDMAVTFNLLQDYIEKFQFSTFLFLSFKFQEESFY